MMFFKSESLIETSPFFKTLETTLCKKVELFRFWVTIWSFKSLM